MEDVLTVARVARHWQNPNGYVIEQLVGTAISSLASEEIRRLAGHKALTAGDLGRVQEQLETLYPGGYPTFGVEPERLNLRRHHPAGLYRRRSGRRAPHFAAGMDRDARSRPRGQPV